MESLLAFAVEVAPEVLSSVLVTATALAFFSNILIKNLVTKDLEAYKSKLKGESDRELALLKNDLEHQRELINKEH